MDLLTILIIAVGLAMDCLAVSIAQGLAVKPSERPRPLLMALLFGLFQGGMPLIGYFAGSLFAAFFDTYAPWIALALLAFIGGKMVWESLHEQQETAAGWQLSRLLILAVATSIDALAMGVIFIPVPEMLWMGIGLIGLVSFLFSIAGYHVGKEMGRLFRLNLEMIGGIVLIGIGLKIWIEGVCL
jgi:putative Mn2+ efflux pump MntP